MQKLEYFNEEQISLFRRICDDACGPTCVTELLLIIDGLLDAFDSDRDQYQNYGQLSEQIESCLSALHFVNAMNILERK